MDRSSTIGYILILVLFVAYLFMNKDTMEQIENQEAAADSTVVVEQKNTDTSVSTPLLSKPDQPVATQLSFEEQQFDIQNEKIKLGISNVGGQPVYLELLKYKRYDSSKLVLFSEEDNKMEYVIPLVSGSTLSSNALDFEVTKQSKSSITLVAKVDSLRSITQSYSIADDSYIVDYNVQFDGFSDIISPKNSYVELNWSTKINQQENYLDEERNNTTVYYKYVNEEDVDYLAETDDDEESLEPYVQWISFKQKFFNMMLINKAGFTEDGMKIETKEAISDDYVEDLSANLFLPVENGQDIDQSFQFYFGPNHYQTLGKLDIEAQKIIPLGWGIFGWVNKLLVIPVFNWLSQYLSNYGVIILILTILIKLILFIPMFKVYKSSAKMRLLKPELDELKEQTGGDMQKMQQAQMKLYKQAGVSPLGGCLPQLVQLPILFAMFRFFPSSIELRQERLWWADDLSTFDSIYDFPNGFEIPFYGDHVSLFTLLMTAITILYTYMNSQNTAGMTGPMKYMMYLMPIMFLGFFNNYAAALSFYYFLATCITIIQNFIIRKFFIDEDKLHRELQENKKKKVKVKKSGLQKRLEEMAKKRGVDPYKKPPSNKRR